MSVENITLDELKNMGVEKVMDKSLAAAKKMSKEELDVYDTIYDHLEELPITFFQKSTEELSDHFGGEVTETVRDALFWSKAELGMIDALTDELNDMADDNE